MNNNKENGQREGNILKGIIAGVAGGLVASFVMNEFQAAWSSISEKIEDSDGGKDRQSADQPEKDEKAKQKKEEQEPATVKAAEMVSESIFDHELTKQEKKYAGPAVHYATGAGTAAVYGAAAEIFPQVTFGAGMPFGTAVWLIVDEGAVPALGISKPPLEYSPATHAYALASHLVFGLSTELVRRVVRRALDQRGNPYP